MLEATPADTLRHLPVDALQPGKYQPRKTMDQAKLAELAESIKAQGVIQPIVVRDARADARFEIIAGERRWRAVAARRPERDPGGASARSTTAPSSRWR